MAKNITGIDLSKVAEYRERVEVTVAPGRDVMLPLIELRDAHMAELFLSRLDAIRTEWAVLTAAYKSKVGLYQGLKKDAEDGNGANEEISASEYYNSIQNVTEAIQESQKQQSVLILKVREISNEIHAFLSPYLEGTEVLDVLRKADDSITQKVLYAMLYGTAAFTDSGDLADEGSGDPDDVKKN